MKRFLWPVKWLLIAFGVSAIGTGVLCGWAYERITRT